MPDDDLQEYLDELSIEAQGEIAEGSAEKGAEICRTLIHEWTKLQGPDGERVLIWKGFLGRALTEARRYKEAEEVLAELLIDRERILGPDDLAVLVTRGNLARAIALGGRPEEAVLLAKQLYSDRLRLVGPDDPSTFDSFGHIAHFHYLMGDYATAAELYENLLQERTRVLGPNHHTVLQTEHNLASARAKSGNPADVQKLLDVAMELQANLGFDDLVTLNAFALVAEAWSRMGDHSEALRLGVLVREGRSRILGDSDARTLSARLLVANALTDLGRWSEAIEETITVVHAGVDQGRADEVSDLSSIASLLRAWLNTADPWPIALNEVDSERLLELAVWLEQKGRQTELDEHYRELSEMVRVALGRPFRA